MSEEDRRNTGEDKEGDGTWDPRINAWRVELKEFWDLEIEK